MASKQKKLSPIPKNRKRLLIVSGAVVFFVFGVFAFILFQDVGASNPEGDSSESYQFIETRPLVSPALFRNPKVAEVYRLAAKIPEVVDQLYCYCHCSTNPHFLHKTLLTCYTDNHAAGCSICLEEVRIAYAGVLQGLTVQDIRDQIDRKYKR